MSRFGACASDNVSAVKPIVFGPIRSVYTTPAGYGGQVFSITCWHKNKTDMTGQCFGHVSERNKKAVHVKHMGIFAAPLGHSRNARTYANVYRFILVQCRYLAASTFFLLRAVRKAEKLPKSSISSAFSDKLAI